MTLKIEGFDKSKLFTCNCMWLFVHRSSTSLVKNQRRRTVGFGLCCWYAYALAPALHTNNGEGMIKTCCQMILFSTYKLDKPLIKNQRRRKGLLILLKRLRQVLLGIRYFPICSDHFWLTQAFIKILKLCNSSTCLNIFF